MGGKRVVRAELAYGSVEEMLFGQAPQPVSAGLGVQIGGGAVLPEVNFTLPPMLVREETFGAVRQSYRDMVQRILTRAVELGQSALVLEFEQLFEMTTHPDWGALITSDIKELMQAAHDKDGLRSALRVTIADILSIESTGGKEVSDQGLVTADVDALAYALGWLCPLDMETLWRDIVEVADRHGVLPGGDTACGFGNTAMQLAHQNLIPKVLAAVVRLMTAPRSLVAVEMGARGPLKDCGYENPVIKAATGVPVSMEGKSSACAHSSPLGNIAAAVCDLWSNESVQDVRLLGGFAPESFSEMLVYDCRLMNVALNRGHGQQLRDMFVASDRDLDPQAVVMDPAVMWEAARRIAEVGPDHYQRGLAMARYGVEVLREAHGDGRLSLAEREARWLGILEASVEALPEDPDSLAGRLDPSYRELYRAEEYQPEVALA
ncbi:MAG: hypothetical protein HUU35_17255 [Armatimonadetes bacterium]|nr:hypothetical protein [Armatimonadota bacterium]